MRIIAKLLKFEFINILRSRWIFFYTFFLIFLSGIFLYLAGTTNKALLTITSVITILIPLTSILFTTFYWYNADKQTELLLTQPLKRQELFISRFLAMSASLGIGFFIGVIAPFFLSGLMNMQLLWVSIFGGFLAVCFCGLGSLIAVSVNDRMRGVGLSFAVWFYFVLIHDMAVIAVLTLAKDYPMDNVATIFVSINPIGITRVVLMVLQDASMLLGHSGALIHQFMLSIKGLICVIAMMLAWLSLPFLLSYKIFLRKDL